MSDGESTGKVALWTEEAKFQFLLRIVAQYKDDGKAINWSRVQMPGRTTKSLQNMWTKINKQVADLEAEQNGMSAPPTPAKKSTPRKRAPKKKAVDNEDEEAEPATPKSAGRKRAAQGTATKRTKKAKKDEDEEAPPAAESSANDEDVKDELQSE